MKNIEGKKLIFIAMSDSEGENLAATDVHKKLKNIYSIKKEALHEVWFVVITSSEANNPPRNTNHNLWFSYRSIFCI